MSERITQAAMLAADHDEPRFARFLEVGGDELASSTSTLADLPYLPLLGASGYFVKGWSHLIAGYPRVGKTDLTMAIVREWLDLGLRVVYITEEPRAIWEPRLAATPGDWSGLRVVFGLGAAVEDLRRRARDGREDIVIVDALRNLLQLKDEKDNSEIARAVNPWVADARLNGKTPVMIHHDRKGGGDHGEAIAGGHAFLGSFDIVIEILRDSNQAKNRRLLRTYARLIESKEAVYEKAEVQFQPIDSPVGTRNFQLLGDPGALRLDDVAERLFSELTDELQTTKELHEQLGEPRPSQEQVRKALMQLAWQHKLRCDPPIEDGPQRGKTRRWASSKTNQSLEDVGSSNGRMYRLELNSRSAPELESSAAPGPLGGPFQPALADHETSGSAPEAGSARGAGGGCPACGNRAWRQVGDRRRCDGPQGCGAAYGEATQ